VLTIPNRRHDSSSEESLCITFIATNEKINHIHLTMGIHEIVRWDLVMTQSWNYGRISTYSHGYLISITSRPSLQSM